MTTKIGHLLDRQIDPSSRVCTPYLVSTTNLGVEIELENISNHIPSRDFLRYWKIVDDGSLRDNGAEFVFKAPLGGLDVVHALQELEQFITTNDITPQLSDRTSVHVHMDIRDITTEQLFNIILTYTFAERVLMRFCGESRIDNNYCVPLSKTSSTFLSRIGRFKDKKTDFLRSVREFGDGNRYAALNLGAISRYGSIEFRGFRGEYKSSELLPWVNMLLSIREYALREDINFNEFHIHISQYGALKVLNDIFGESLFKRFNTEYLMEDMRGCVGVVQDLLFNFDIITDRSTNIFTPVKSNRMRMEFMKVHNPDLYAAMISTTAPSSKTKTTKKRTMSIDELLEMQREQMRERIQVRQTAEFVMPDMNIDIGVPEVDVAEVHDDEENF